jgi:3-deoxy-D-manno-octulosonic-acid transferase
MRFVYNCLFTVLFVLAAPFYFLKMWRRGNWKADFGQRFACYSDELKARFAQKPVIWIHAVSVGEVGVCVQLLKLLSPQLPHHQIVVSTTTSTGMGELRSKLPDSVIKIYYPIDFWWGARHALNTIRPKAFLLIEAEFWPNLLWQAMDRNLPLLLINARVSDRSFPRYQKGGFLFRPIFSRFSVVCCQNALDAERLKMLGFPADATRDVGNLKFDAALPQKPGSTAAKPALDVRELLARIGFPGDAQLWVCGSTHAGEEAILGAMFLRLRQKHPQLRLVLVPRHFERAREVSAALETAGVKFMLRTEITTQPAPQPGTLDCLVVNSTGELKAFYSEATVVFVGKSLTAKGGQNPIEPVALGKATVLGPNMQNFTSIVATLNKGGGIMQVADASGLERAIDDLLSRESHRRELGRAGLRVVEENSGATPRTVDLIVPAFHRAGLL